MNESRNNPEYYRGRDEAHRLKDEIMKDRKMSEKEKVLNELKNMQCNPLAVVNSQISMVTRQTIDYIRSLPEPINQLIAEVEEMSYSGKGEGWLKSKIMCALNEYKQYKADKAKEEGK
jgi:hypothetical protein